MKEEHYVVVGNGPAGNEAATTLRDKAPSARITLIGREHRMCYRPKLLPAYLSGTIEEEGLYALPLEHYQEKDIKLRLGQRVVGLIPDRKELVLDHKEIVPFTGLILAVGGTPRIPENLHIFRELMFTLKTVSDAKRWMKHLREVEHVLMIGGDLTSFAVTQALLDMGKRVAFVLNEESFRPLRSSPEIYEEAAHVLKARGVEVIEGRRVRGMSRLGQDSIEVMVEDKRISTQMVGAFFGLVPDVGFLVRSGLHIESGVLVDETLHTGSEGIYAAGDCAQVYHPALRDYWVSIGHDNAANLGRIAAQNLLGEQIEVRVPAESIFQVDGIKVNTSWWKEF